MPTPPAYRPSRAHEALGDSLFDRVVAAEFPRHVLRHRNDRAAADIGLDSLTDAEWIDHFGRFAPLPGTLPQPLALRYHGHQFRTYNPQLGDGRGFLLAQCHDRDGRLLDLGTKGSGQTPWSRGGDGRLTLKGGVRELLATEMLEALGVATSRTFSLIETGESLHRGDEPSPTRACVLVRLSHSHIRIGTFQRLLYLDDIDGIARLVDHVVEHYLPGCADPDRAARTLGLFEAACRGVARMGADWMLAGFVHGVLNTDNINILGESFDYGPWRFLPVLDPRFTAAYFDETGLYAFGRQPDTLLWNLTRLAECLVPLADPVALEAILARFQAWFHAAFHGAMLRRLGLASNGEAEDSALTQAIRRFLLETGAPFEQALFDLFGGLSRLDQARGGHNGAVYGREAFAPVRDRLGAYRPRAGARLDDPYFARSEPETMLIDEVEAIWAGIAASDDWSMLTAKLRSIAAMARATRPRPEGSAPAVPDTSSPQA